MWRMCGVCVVYVWRMCGVCVAYVWYLCDLCEAIYVKRWCSVFDLPISQLLHSELSLGACSLVPAIQITHSLN